ncbi:MAG TPA: peptidoglycan DD-metalloendopeptidase family protein, partial [Myxococcota bacterium]|nr:peptidoglycan DD-metalloendopeptidase family protein [Myxococcota bacterium]
MGHADPAPKRGSFPAAPLSALAVAPSGVQIGTPRPPQWRVSEGVITRGRTLSQMLRSDGATPQSVHQIALALKGRFNFRKAMPGHSYRLILDGKGNVQEFRYHVSPLQSFTVKRVQGELVASTEEGDLDGRSTRIAGVITSTLYQAITNLGEDGSLARDFADIFAWDVDFERELRPGDNFQILYERLYRAVGGRETYVRPGRILAARFQGESGDYTAVYFEARGGNGSYYRPDGSSVEGEFLMAPLRHARITSDFSAARRHPILKITRPHHGIDYAASIGTPVWAVADGVVIQRSWAGGNGNLVQIRHENGYVSSYAHLSRYADGLRVGDRVEQKQVIGYVGQTGLATGPHVCFRIQRNGKYVDPAGLRMSTGLPIAKAQVPAFRAMRDARLAELAGQRRI